MVGAEEEVFYVHKTMLERHSDFFVKALQKEWVEGSDKCVKLPEDDPALFKLFVAFVYTGKIYFQHQPESQPEDTCEEWHICARAWVLGDKYQATSFKDAIVDALLEKIEAEDKVPIGMHRVIYANTATASPMRKILVDIAVYEWHDGRVEDLTRSEAWNDFFTDLAVKLHSLRHAALGTAPYKSGSGCLYHEHEAAGKPCYKKMFEY